MQQGILYVIATPIGNLDDITYRAVKVLRELDIILAESARSAEKICKHFDITTGKVLQYNEHIHNECYHKIITYLTQGKKIGLISDAGTPCISDPGAFLISTLRKDKFTNISPIPGCSAPIAALSASGFLAKESVFLGFLPKSSSQQVQILEKYSHLNCNIILFERGERISKFVPRLIDIFYGRKLLIARELTKIYEEFIYLDIDDKLRDFPQHHIKGEAVIIIEGGMISEQHALSPIAREKAQITEDLRYLLSDNRNARQVVEIVARYSRSLSRNAVYNIAVDLLAERE